MRRTISFKKLSWLIILAGVMAWGSVGCRAGESVPTPIAQFEIPPPVILIIHATPTLVATQAAIEQNGQTQNEPTQDGQTQDGQTHRSAPTQAITETPTLPTEHYIHNISGHKQYFPLGCETATAKDWANYFNKDFNEFEFQYKLPLSDNPDLGFVGSVESPWGQVPPYGYGVYAGPVADLLNAYGIPAKAYKNYTLEQIKDKIALDKPVIVWVIGNMVGGVPAEYTDKLGNKVIVAAYEHVVIVTGYSATHIRYMNNGHFYETPNEVFLNSWGVLGNMVVVDE